MTYNFFTLPKFRGIWKSLTQMYSKSKETRRKILSEMSMHDPGFLSTWAPNVRSKFLCELDRSFKTLHCMFLQDHHWYIWFAFFLTNVPKVKLFWKFFTWLTIFLYNFVPILDSPALTRHANEAIWQEEVYQKVSCFDMPLNG